MIIKDDAQFSGDQQGDSREESRGSSRREFLRSALAGGLAASYGVPALAAGVSAGNAGSTKSPGVLFEGYAVPILHQNVYESTLAGLRDGHYWLLYGDNEKHLFRQASTDGGRTWDQPQPVRAADGSFIDLARRTAHLSLFRLKSGAWGMVYGGPVSRPGRDGTLIYRISKDEGKSWSAPLVVDPVFAICRAGSVRVLRSGRIMAPTLKWISPDAGQQSEHERRQFVFSWIFYSDDEGQTWHRSLSELFVMPGDGLQGSYKFDEPSLAERNDGSILMFGRNDLARFYQAVSKDGGISWLWPEPSSLATSISPPYLARIPSTGDLLTVWNQASTKEIHGGLARHRLSTAISSDGGATWKHFRNLESLDNRTHIEPPPATPVHAYRQTDYKEPTDNKLYPHAPGCLRICYPTVAFNENEVAFAYDYGFGGRGELKDGSTTKIKIVSLDWLYGRI